MVVALIYLLLILALVYTTGFFGLFNDAQVSKKTFSVLFFFKALAIPVFYWVYAKAYGGLEKYDAGVFYNDAKAIHDFALTDPLEFLKLMFGLQDDSEGSYVYNHCLIYTHNWDNGKIRDFFYNDNRIVIRLHAVLQFIAFGSYFAQALFNCFLSFVGVVYLYKTFKDFFVRKETWLLIIFCFFPTLWFYTGAVLKEGITLFVLGCTLYTLKKLIQQGFGLRALLWLIFLLFTCCLLKPYLLWFAVLCFGLFFIIQRFVFKRQMLVFFSAIVLMAAGANGLSLLLKHKSLGQAAMARQRVFADAAKGGIFLLDAEKFVRLEYDSHLVKRTREENHYTIKAGVPYIYWEHTHQQDTLFCAANTDTLTHYKLVYQLRESGSNFDTKAYDGAGLIFSSLYYSLCYPFFYNAHGALQLVASGENLAVFMALLIFLWGLFKRKKEALPALVFVLFALCLCWLVGLTTPNSGAIFRYRSPAVIFILAAALYYLHPKSKPAN